ncbi:glutathione S-transferase [Podospora conica]|nr:glutathione S-transferase [Schizothecium conicum]
MSPPTTTPLLTLYSGDRRPNQTHSLSMFSTKLQLRLRHAGVSYTTAFATRNDGPRQKLPFIKLAGTDELLGDTALITKHLVAAGHLPDVNEVLAEEKRAVGYCVTAMVEDRFNYLVAYERWFEHADGMRESVFGFLPWGVRHVVGYGALQYARAMMYFQGTGRFSAEEVGGFMEEAVGVLGALAGAARGEGEGKGGVFWILGGEGPSEADFAVFGGLSALLVRPGQPKVTAMIRGDSALMEYMEGINKVYFPDFEDWP